MDGYSSKTRIFANSINFLILTVGMFVWVAILEIIAPNLVPFGLFDMWYVGNGDLGAALRWFFPIFAIPIVMSVVGITIAMRRNKILPEYDLVDMFHISIRAGVLEEVLYRWLFFYTAIATIRILDALFFRLLFGFSVDEFIYTKILLPIADTATLHVMSHLIFTPTAWFIGAAVISANGKFRNGHAYQGIVGLVHSWFIGMMLFFIMFTYGLIAAIVIHILYDLIVFGTGSVMRITVGRNYNPYSIRQRQAELISQMFRR